MSEQRLIDANVFIRDLTAMKSMYDAISLDGMIKALKEAPTVEERPKGKRTKVYIVVKGNYALSNSMWLFSSRELACEFGEYLRKELDDGVPLNIIELEIDEAVLTEEDL